jgi:hypothetical protein
MRQYAKRSGDYIILFFLVHDRSSGDHIRPRKTANIFFKNAHDPAASITRWRVWIPYLMLVLSMV